MKVAAISYLSRAGLDCYPFETVYRSVAPLIDEYWVCTATAEDDAIAASVESTGVLHHVLPLVETPNDISRLMGAAFRAARDASDADVFLLVQADTAACAGPLGRFLGALKRVGYARAAMQLGCTDARIYHHASYGWGYTVVGRDASDVFVGDGVAPRAAHFMIAAPEVCCVHLGFLSVDGLLAHYALNGRVWSDLSLVELHAQGLADREAFVREILLRHARTFRAPLAMLQHGLDAAFEPFIEQLGLASERRQVLEMARACDPGWP